MQNETCSPMAFGRRIFRGVVMLFDFLLIAVLVCFAIGSAIAQTPTPTASTPGADLILPSAGPWGINLSDRDASVKPGDDFYMSQNGAWFARTELGPQRPLAAYWSDLRRIGPRRIDAFLKEAAANTSMSPESPEGKAGAFYRAFLDEKAAEEKGVKPLEPELATFRAATTKAQMAALLGHVAGPGTPNINTAITGQVLREMSVFSVSIQQDREDRNRSVVHLGQAGLNLPGPEYYFDPKLADLKAAYEAYVGKMLTLLGWPKPEDHARDVVALETKIAQVSWSQEQMRDVVKTYNPMTVVELTKLTPDFDWRAFLTGAELAKVERVVIDAKDAFPKIAQVFAETPMETWQARQAFVLVDDAAGASYLNGVAYQAAFDFHKLFTNKSALPLPREKRAASVVIRNLPDVVGSLYVKHYFPAEAKAAVQAMVTNLRAALDARLQGVTWLTPETKTKAREKIAGMTVRVGAPDKFETYRGLEISEKDLYGNAVRATAFEWKRRVDKLNGPFDRSEWNLTPDYANYDYSPTANTVEMPAAMFEPPFFDLHADAAVNYGAIGAQIGQTMLAALDNTGRQYDANGQQHDWWTAAEIDEFTKRRSALAAQYSAIEPLPGIHVKGDLVVDEAIDDLGGLLIALDAYHLSLKGEPAPVIAGFTGDQRFFLGRAQMWRAKFDPAFVRTQLTVGRNSQPFLRVNGPVSNIDAWYDAFKVQPTDKMYIAPEQRVRIW